MVNNVLNVLQTGFALNVINARTVQEMLTIIVETAVPAVLVQKYATAEKDAQTALPFARAVTKPAQTVRQ